MKAIKYLLIFFFCAPFFMVSSKPISPILAELESIWPPNSCGTYSTFEKGIPVYSIACSGDYTEKERKEFLNVLFREGFKLRNESYKHGDRSGYYLYRVETATGRGDFAFFKLYLRNAQWLYPNLPGDGARVLLYVREPKDIETVMAWHSLGVPIVFGLNILDERAPILAKKITEYDQSYFISFPLEPRHARTDDGPYIEISDSLNDSDLGNKIDSQLSKFTNIRGFSYTLGKEFTQNVFAMRTLLNHVRGQGLKFYFDPDASGVAYETSRIMSFQSYKATKVIRKRQKNYKSLWRRAVTASKKTGYSLVIVDANAESARKYISLDIRRKKVPPSAFLKLEGLPVQPN